MRVFWYKFALLVVAFGVEDPPLLFEELVTLLFWLLLELLGILLLLDLPVLILSSGRGVDHTEEFIAEWYWLLLMAASLVDELLLLFIIMPSLFFAPGEIPEVPRFVKFLASIAYHHSSPLTP